MESPQNDIKLRNFVITSFVPCKYDEWLKITDERIRLLSWQLEKTSKGKVHLQAYLEATLPLKFSQIKTILGDRTLHIEPRMGTRQQAYDYTRKEEGVYWETKYPDWRDHGARIPGTEHRQIGVFSKRQGERTDLLKVADLIEDGASETTIMEKCTREYIKYSTGVRRAIALREKKRRGHHIDNLEVIVLYGDTRTGKTRWAKDKYGVENVFEPVFNGNKYWFDGYDGEGVLLLNEFTGQMGTGYMQQLLDPYYQLIEGKGYTTVSNWHTIVITSNLHPRDWYDKWVNETPAVEDSFIERITKWKKFTRHKKKKRKTWDDIEEVTESSITSVTSVPPFPVPSPFTNIPWRRLNSLKRNAVKRKNVKRIPRG